MERTSRADVVTVFAASAAGMASPSSRALDHMTDKAASGVPGLDSIMAGGFTRGCFFLLEGNPGTGKTTLALRFLLEGQSADERNLYITLSETKGELLNGLPRVDFGFEN